MNLTTQRVIDVPPQMILEIAHGLEDPARIAERHGFGEAEWFCLLLDKAFIQQVDDKKSELSAGGFTFRLKAAVAAEAILTEVASKALAEGASFGLQLEALKFTAKCAGLDAPIKEAVVGTSVSITINLGGGQTVQVAVIKPTEAIDVEDVAFIEMDDVYGEVPPHLFAGERLMAVEA